VTRCHECLPRRPTGAEGARAGGQAWAVNERQAEALTRAAEALRCAAASAAGRLPLDFWALDLRGALLALGEARAPARNPPGVGGVTRVSAPCQSGAEGDRGKQVKACTG